MYFVKRIKELANRGKLTLFVDMDGVIADYQLLEPLDFEKKRPIVTNIKTLEKISHLPKVKICILSICLTKEQRTHKIKWLQQNAPFLSQDNFFIIVKETHPGKSSKELKKDFIQSFEKQNDEQIVVIDDDNEILSYLSKQVPGVLLFQDSSMID